MSIVFEPDVALRAAALLADAGYDLLEAQRLPRADSGATTEATAAVLAAVEHDVGDLAVRALQEAADVRAVLPFHLGADDAAAGGYERLERAAASRP
ncbi:hypothetical protein GCM10023340_03070 [Nocardioides marinquilinus]|uniref:Uncharacterized protein n=1 Tax=Nocardioides marinquilinus TaxID=1210400 RepID=A0ABP9P6L1_9ACTN